MKKKQRIKIKRKKKLKRNSKKGTPTASLFDVSDILFVQRYAAKKAFPNGNAFMISIKLVDRNDPVECILDLAPLDTCHCIIEHL